MIAVVLIPWRGGEVHRERNKAFVVDYYAALGLPIFLGDSGHERFNRGASRNAAATAAGDWDVALIADADCVADLDAVRGALQLAEQTGKLVIAHDDFWRLSDKGTAKLIRHPERYLDDPRQVVHLMIDTRLWRGYMPSGALAISRDSFEKIGGYASIPTWGYEDSLFLEDARREVGVDREPGWMWHLWHPRETGTVAERELNRRIAQEHRARQR